MLGMLRYNVLYTFLVSIYQHEKRYVNRAVRLQTVTNNNRVQRFLYLIIHPSKQHLKCYGLLILTNIKVLLLYPMKLKCLNE